MSSRNWWRLGFLGVTGLAVAGELLASVDGNADTEPWTTLIVTTVPAEVTIAAIGALALWLPFHFIRRYRRRGPRQPPTQGRAAH